MKMTYAILDSLLRRSCRISRRGSWNQSEEIHGIRLWDGEEKRSHILYLAADPFTSQTLEKKAYICGRSVLTIISPSEEGLILENTENPGYFLHWPTERKQDALNAVWDIFYSFECWSRDIYELAYIDKDLDRILQKGCSYLECSSSIVNAHFEFELIAGYQGMEKDWTPFLWKNDRVIMPLIEEMLLTHPDFDQTFLEDDLTYFENLASPELSCYYYNFRYNGEYVGRILINSAQEHTPGFWQLCKYYVKMVEIGYIAYLERKISHLPSDDLHRAFRMILSGEVVERAHVQKELQKISWKESDQYEMIKLSTTGYAHSPHTLAYYCHKIEMDIPAIMAVNTGETITCIHNLSVIGENKHENENSREKFILFMRENLFQGGVSSRFRNFFDSLTYDREAGFALSDGFRKKPDMWLHRFEDSALQYCLEKITEEYPVSDLIHPALKELFEYDRQNPETQLTRTLYQFIQNQYNAAYTARILQIHRTTLLYRLNKMQKIYPFCLEDPKTCLHIQLSYELMPQLKTGEISDSAICHK